MVLRTIFQTIKQHRQKNGPLSYYSYLDNTPYLHDSDYLRELYGAANTREKKEKIYGYLERFEVNDRQYKGYFSLYEQISDDLGYAEKEDDFSLGIGEVYLIRQMQRGDHHD